MADSKALLNRAIPLIEGKESVRTQAYLDVRGIPTICAGLTTYPNGVKVEMGDVCSLGVCRAMLIERLEKEFLPRLRMIPGWSRLHEDQQLALVSFAWNAGAYFFGSKGYEAITQVLKEGAANPAAYERVPEVLMLYIYAGNEPLLRSRREKEANLWRQGMSTVQRFIARQDTKLKIVPIDSSYLSEKGIREVPANTVLEVTQVVEIPQSAHDWFVLNGGEKWAVWGPHWLRQQAQPAPVTPVEWDNFSAPVGSFISVGEILRYDQRRKPRVGSAEEKNIIEIAKEFDKIRAAWGSGIAVTSGYRPEPINMQVGGVPGSTHTQGRALDIYPVNGRLEAFHSWLVQRWTGGYGDGRRKGFIHIDTRGNGKFEPRGGVKPWTLWDY